MTLYMKLGGRRTINQMVPRLVDRLKQDSQFSAEASNQLLAVEDDLAEFLTFLFGGAPFYDGQPIADLLSPICKCVTTYDRFVDHLVAVLSNNDHTGTDAADLRILMDRLRPHILSPKPVAPVLVYSVEPEMLSA